MVFRKLSEFEAFVQSSSWQNFEELVGSVFEAHDFDVRVSVVKMFEHTKRQYDVLATRYGTQFSIECKHWKKSCESRIISAAKKHAERSACIKAIPIMVTLLDDGIVKAAGVWVVPVFALNEFILTRC